MGNIRNWKDSVEDVLTEIEDALSEYRGEADRLEEDFNSLDDAYINLYGIEEDSVDDTDALCEVCTTAETLRNQVEYKRDVTEERISYLEDVVTSLENALNEMDYLD